MRKDSLKLTDEDGTRIVEHVRRSRFSRIVITYGTDTMTQTARVLSVIPDKTTVLTGALAPARFSESDAAFQFGRGVRDVLHRKTPHLMFSFG